MRIIISLFCFGWLMSAFSSAAAGFSREKLQKLGDVQGKEFVPQAWEKNPKPGLLAFNPAGTLIAESVRIDSLWRDRFGPNIKLLSSKGYLLRTLKGNEDCIKSIIFSNDGKLIAAADERGVVSIWAVANGNILSSWQVDTANYQELAGFSFSDNNEMLITATISGVVKVWDLSGSVLETFKVFNNNNAIWLVNRGKNVVTMDRRSQTIKVWDLSGKSIKEFPVPNLDQILSTNRNQIICFSKVFVNDAGPKGYVKPKGFIGLKGYISIWDIHGNKIKGWYLDGRLPSSSAKDDAESVAGDWSYVDYYSPVAVSADGRYFADAEGNVWDQSGQLLSFPGRFTGVHGHDHPRDIAVSINGEIVFRTTDGELEVWSAINKTLSRKIKHDVGRAIVVGIVGDNFVITPSLRLFDLSGKFIRRVSTTTEAFGSVMASPDGEKIAGYTGHIKGDHTSNSIYLWDSNWKLLKKFENLATENISYNEIMPFAFSPDSKFLAITVGKPDKVKIWDVKKNAFISEIGADGKINDLYFTSEGRLAVESGQTVVWDLIDGKRYAFSQARSDCMPKDINNGDTHQTYSPNANLLAHGVPDKEGAIRVIDNSTGQVIKESALHSRKLTGLYFSKNGKFLISSSEDNTVAIWNTRTWESIRLISDVTGEWLTYALDGHFDASLHGGKLLAMVEGLDAYDIEQFAARYNRPDLLLERMDLADSETIAHYQRLYHKRLRKLGLNEARLTSEPQVPEAKITRMEQNNKLVKVSFQLSDKKIPLNRYSIYVNDVPLFDLYGREISGNSFSGSESIELTHGKNKIEISAINAAGAESYRALAYAEYRKQIKGELYYLAFGLSKYKDSALDLNYADKDAKDLEDIVLKMRPAYSNIHTKTLVNSDVTAENIRKAKDFLKSATVDDTVVLLIAGHGGYDKTKESKYYYLPYEASLDDLTGTGVDFEKIEDLLNGIKPRKKLFLMDTCESGELDEETYDQYYTLADARGLKPRTFRKPIRARGQADRKVRRYLYQKDRYIYNDLARRSGAIVFSSSRGGELSYESSNIKNGFFTKEVITALTTAAADKNYDGFISVKELKDFVSDAVAKDTGDLQHPTIDRDNLYQDIEFPLLRTIGRGALRQ